MQAFYLELAFDAASKITSATLAGCASIMTWLEGAVVVVAPIFFACAASRSGDIARSFAAMMYHDGFDCQAGVVTSPFIAATLIGTCVAVRIAISLAERSCAKSSAIPLGVSLRKPLLSGRSSEPMGVGTLVMRPKAVSPVSGATADT